MSLVYPPYPPTRYTGDNGEVSSTIRRPDSPADFVTPDTEYHYLATQSSTDGDFGLYRADLRPRFRWSRTAFPQDNLSESFFVLSGTVRLYDGREWIDGHAGDFLYVPPGGIHGFRNEAPEPVSMLAILFAPGAPRERSTSRTSWNSPV